jgi:hypothetical protein
MNVRRRATAAAWAVLGLAAAAQDAAPESAARRTGPEANGAAFRAAFGGSSTYVLSGDVEGAPDGVDVWINALEARLEYDASRATRLGFTANFEHRDYDFGAGNAFFAGVAEPFSDVRTYGAAATLRQDLGNAWALSARAGISFSAANGADLGDGTSWDAFLGVGKRFDETLTVGLGPLVLGRLEDDVLVVPAPFFEWRFAEDWRLRSAGPGLELAWRCAADVELALDARWDGRRFRLSDAAPFSGGLVEDARVPIRLSLRYDATPALRLGVHVGFDAYRAFDVYDADGDRREAFSADAGVFGGVSLELRL